MLRDASILGLARALPIGLAVVQSVVVARILGPPGFGALAVIATYPALVFGVLNARTVEVTTRFLADFDARGAPGRAIALCKIAYAIDLAVAAGAATLVAATAGTVAPRVLEDASLAPLMVVFAMSFVPQAFVPTSTAVLAVSGRFRQTAALEATGAALRTALVLTLVAVGAGLPGVVYGTVAGNAALGLAMLVAAHREAKRRWGRSWARGRWADLAGHRREIGRFFALSDLTALCNTAIKNSDVLILGLFRPAVEVGYYNLGKSLASQVLVLTSAVRSVAFPTIMRLWAAGAWDEIWRTVRSHTWRLAGAGIPAVAALILAMGWALRMVYGVDYVPAAPVARLLLLQVVLVLLTMWLDMVLVAWGQARLLLVTRALGALVVVGGTFLLAPFWGIQAAAAMLLLQQVISALITTSWMHAHRRAGRREAQRRSRIRPSAAPDC